MVLDQQERTVREEYIYIYTYMYRYIYNLPGQEQKPTLKLEEMVSHNGRAQRFSMTALLLMDLLFLVQGLVNKFLFLLH